ncbi:MAG: hypothetical protein OJF52_000488 [Nitrospira sp.]|jgi:hypothetical protein|nr:MAG: hypothetical protein OJF52_000488 [Nitrospira sp.]
MKTSQVMTDIPTLREKSSGLRPENREALDHLCYSA